MQRLFSTFANGWPGIGLVLLRLLTGVAVIHVAITGANRVLQIIGVGVGILVLIGLWTPMAGALVAIVSVWSAVSRYFSHAGDPWIAILQAVLGAALAMVGPGAWSIDARLFGRKHISMSAR